MRRILVVTSLLFIGGCETAPNRPTGEWDAKLHETLNEASQQSPDISVIETLLRNGANANSRDEFGHSAMWKALDRERYDAVELLLDHGADPDTLDAIENPGRGTPLCILISVGRYYGPSSSGLELIRALLLAGADTGATCPGGQSVIALALDIANHRSLSVLADAGVRLRSEPDLETAARALAEAAGQSDDETVAALIALELDVNRKPLNLPRPLEAALHDGYRASTALLLLEAGATSMRSDAIVTAVERMNGDLPLVMALLAAGADPNGADALGQTALTFGIRRGYIEVLRTLLDAGVDPDQTGSKLPHPLHLVFQSPEERRLPVADLLISAGADIHARTRDGTTVLMRAAGAHDYALTKLALASGADPAATKQTGQTAADLAITSGATLKLLDLLGETPAEKRENRGNRLSRAVTLQSRDDLHGLIEEGIDLNIRGYENQTALETAGRNGYRSMFQALLDGGADPNVSVLDGSPLQRANARVSAIHLRRQRELDEDADASIPLIASAFLAGNSYMLERLLQAGADPNALSASGDTTLHLAHAANWMLRQVARVILDGGADPNLTNNAGFTPMTLAAKHRSIDLMRILLDHGVDINAADREGRTALSQTLDDGYSFRNAKELVERGAIPSAADVETARRRGNRLLFRLISDAGNPN